MHDKKHLRGTNSKKKAATTFVVDGSAELLVSLIKHVPQKNRKIIKAVLRDRQVKIDGKVVTQFDHIVHSGQCVEVSWDRVLTGKQAGELDIIFEDQDLIIINKPSGLLTVATDKEKRKTAYSLLSSYVKQENADNKIFIIHRLDRETSGLLMFAKNETIKHTIQKTWDTTIAQRTYVGVVEGEISQVLGTVTSWLTESKAFIVYSSQNSSLGRKAVTHYTKLKGNASFSLLHLQLETGRKHQIRVHMQDIGHPIIGDKKYGSTQNPIKRMGLHAQVLAFTHPTTGAPCRFETAVPQQFLKLFSSRSDK